MLRTIFTLSFLYSALIGFSQEFSFVLKGQIFNTSGDKIQFVQNHGPQNESVIASIDLDENGHFEQEISVQNKDYYILRLEDGQAINIVVENSDTIKVYADGRSLFYNSNIVNSEASSKLLEFVRFSSQYKQQLDSAEQYLQANQDKQREIQQEFQPIYQNFINVRQGFINENINSPALLGVISTLNFERELSLYEKIVNALNESFGESPTVKNIVLEFENNKRIIQAQQPLAPGNEAKEIALPNPEGDTLRLSDYRGKVVLIDFWASWCGPCRRENPNVVNVYNKYKDKGFEVFSVSLDRTMDAWVKAIEQDNLTWEGHVSDLKFWQSEAAKAYGVSSIPFTVLIDEEGKIIGTNIRGPQLEIALKEIFD